MGTITLSPRKYGSLLSQALPKVIETDEDLERLAGVLENPDTSDQTLTREEIPLQPLLPQPLPAYDDRIDLPDVPPLEMLHYLMEQRGLRQADLVPVFGSRSVASNVLTGKRELSKAHIRGLADFFHLSPEVFF